jgi:hypothetical protein
MNLFFNSTTIDSYGLSFKLPVVAASSTAQPRLGWAEFGNQKITDAIDDGLG